MSNEVRTMTVTILDPFGQALYSFVVTSTGLESLGWKAWQYLFPLNIGQNAALQHAVKVEIR